MATSTLQVTTQDPEQPEVSNNVPTGDPTGPVLEVVNNFSSESLASFNEKMQRAERMFDPAKITIVPAKREVLSEVLEHLSESIRQSRNPRDVFKMQLKFVLLSTIAASPLKLEYSREDVAHILDVASIQLSYNDEVRMRFLTPECFDEIFEFYFYQVSRPFDEEE
jgi:hypothetical protein